MCIRDSYEIIHFLNSSEFESFSITGSGSAIFSIIDNNVNVDELKSYIESSNKFRVSINSSIEGWRFQIDWIYIKYLYAQHLYDLFGPSSNGRTLGFGPSNGGSNPSGPVFLFTLRDENSIIRHDNCMSIRL